MEQIKIFNYPWHISHQNALMQISETKWFWLIQHRRKYADGPRGDMISRYGIEWVPHYESGKYDVALLHLDQQCFEENIRDRGKGSLFIDVDNVIIDIPKIIIMHGTPYYPEMFACDIYECNIKECDNIFVMDKKKLKVGDIESYQCPKCQNKDEVFISKYTKDQVGMSHVLIEELHKIIQSCDYVIFNSKQAAKQWGITDETKGKTIWHGMNEEDWWDLPKEPRVVTMISPGGLDKYYDRAFLGAVKDELEERGIIHCHITVDAKFKDFDEYRDFLGRSLIYFNPTRESCMPRSRTEAMFSGCCVVTTPHQDADEFIENGENGLLVPRNPKTAANIIEALIFDYNEAIKIGQKGKETVKKLFSGNRFRSEWREVLETVINNYKK